MVNGTKDEEERRLRRLRLWEGNACTTLEYVRKRTDLDDVPLLQQIYANSPEQLKLFKEEYCRFNCTHFDDTCPKLDRAIEEAERLEKEKELHSGK
jgi:hypothetical protein